MEENPQGVWFTLPELAGHRARRWVTEGRSLPTFHPQGASSNDADAGAEMDADVDAEMNADADAEMDAEMFAPTFTDTGPGLDAHNRLWDSSSKHGGHQVYATPHSPGSMAMPLHDHAGPDERSPLRNTPHPPPPPPDCVSSLSPTLISLPAQTIPTFSAPQRAACPTDHADPVLENLKNIDKQMLRLRNEMDDSLPEDPSQWESELAELHGALKAVR